MQSLSSPSSSASGFLASSSGSGRSAAIVTLLLLGASAGAAATLALQSARTFWIGRNSKQIARRNAIEALQHWDLPVSMIDTSVLSQLELGSDAIRDLFFLTFRSSSSSSPSSSSLSPQQQQQQQVAAGATFTNHGSYGAVPRVVMEYFHGMLARVENNPDLWFRMQSWIMTRKAIQPFAEMVHCDPDCLVFVNNATTAVNAVLHSLDLEAGDYIVCFDSTYNACKIAMHDIANKKGAHCIEVGLVLPLVDEAQVLATLVDQLDTLIASGKRIKFALIDAITSPTAIVMPYCAMAKLLKAREILCMIDGAHALGQLDIDLSSGASSEGIDWFTTNIHKWSWGPKGTALLYAAPGFAQTSLHPLVASHNHGSPYTKAWWMQGTREDSAYISATEGVKFAKAIGIQRAREYTKNLADWAEEMAVERLGGAAATIPICPPSMRAPNMRLIRLPWVVPVSVADRAPMAERLGLTLSAQFSLVLPIIYESHTQAFWIRFSTQIYNRREDYERMIECIIQFAKQPEQKQLLRLE